MKAMLLFVLVLAGCAPQTAVSIETRRVAVDGSGCAWWITERREMVALPHRHGPMCPRNWGGR